MAMTTGEYTTTRPIRERPARTPRDPRLLRVAWGVGLAALTLVLGAEMKSNADFSAGYVTRQLSEQRITFKAADALTAEERGTPCLVEYAGQPLTTGEQAECYANQFIGRHLKAAAGGKTYSEMREVQTSLRARIAEAQATKDPALADLQRQLAEATAQRQTLFEGETVRGLLLTSYGFSELGSKADDAATVAYAAGGAVLVLSVFSLVRVMMRRPTERWAGHP